MKIKRALSFLMAMVMVFAVCTTAFADSTGTINLKNATKGKTYNVYKVFDAQTVTSGSETGVSYTYTPSGASDAFLTAMQGSSSPFTLSGPNSNGAYSVSLVDGKTGEDVASFLKNYVSSFTSGGNWTADDSGEHAFTDLPYGYYYVTNGDTDATVMIDSLTSDSVTIVDKNMKPGWNEEEDEDGNTVKGKAAVDSDGNEVETTSANYGDTQKYTLTFNAVEYDGTDLINYYYFKDELGDGFTGYGSTFTVKVIKADGSTVTLASGGTDGYTRTLESDGKSFTVTVPFGERYGTKATIVVEYDAIISDDATIAGAGVTSNTTNSAEFWYTFDETPDPDPEKKDGPFEETKTTAEVEVLALAIQKTDKSGNALKGATFSVKDPDGKQIKATAVSGKTGYYNYDTAGTVTEFATDDNGLFVLEGIKEGDYTVTEVVAPDGYNKLSSDVTVTLETGKDYTKTITPDASTGITKTYSTDDVPVSGLVVINNLGTELPSTGGIGTTIFYIIGAVLVMGVGIVAVTQKRMKKQK